MTHTHLPEASFQDDMLTGIHAAPITAIDAEDEGQDPGSDHTAEESDRFTVPSQQGMPLSPATSDSSGPHSPTNTGYGNFPMRMPPNILPQDSKPMPETAPMPGYFAPPLAPVEKSGFWSTMPPGMQFGY